MGYARLGWSRHQLPLTIVFMVVTILILRSAVSNEAFSIVSAVDESPKDEPQTTVAPSDTNGASIEDEAEPLLSDQVAPFFDELAKTYLNEYGEPYFDEYGEPYSSEQPEPLFEQYIPETLFDTATTAAVILETRANNNLVPLMLHFAGVLGPTWPILLYTSQQTADQFEPNIALGRMEHQIAIRVLPEGTDISNHDSISAFLTTGWFWESLAPAKHVLMFQSDSIICSNSEVDIDDFLQYDFVGAPIAATFGKGFNGGLSLRNREKLLQIVNEHNWKEEHTGAMREDRYDDKFEDQWFVEKLKGLPNSRIPSEDEAKLFAVETVWSDQTLGFHQLQRWQSSHVEEVEGWCPEVKLVIGGAFA